MPALRRAFALALLLSACDGPMPLPSAPEARKVPGIASFSPASAHAGTRVVVSGTAFGNQAATVRVQFGRGPAVAPATLSDDGTELGVDVPEGSTDGAVSVTTSGGAATSEASFRYLGAGKLRRGALAREIDLRPSACGAVGDAAGGIATFDCEGQRLFGVDGEGMVGAPGGIAAEVFLLEGDAAGTAVFAIRASPPGVCDSGVGLCRAALPLEPGARHACGCLPTDVSGVPNVAVDPRGERAVVTFGGQMRLFDYRHDPVATSSGVVGGAGLRADAPVAWIGPNTFVVSALSADRFSTVLYRVDATSLRSDAVYDVEEAGFDTCCTAIASGPGNKLAVASAGVVRTFDTSQWPPVPQYEGRTHAAEPLWPMRWSTDGRHLAAMQLSAEGLHPSRFVVWDTEATTPLPVRVAEDDEWWALGTAPSGAFLVPGRGGVSVRSPDTGESIGMYDLRADVSSLHLRAGADDGDPARVVVLAHALGRLHRFDAESAAPVDFLPAPAVGSLDDTIPNYVTAGQGGRPGLFVHNNTILRDDTGADARLVQLWPTTIVPSPQGRWLAAIEEGRDAVGLLDLDADWSSLSPLQPASTNLAPVAAVPTDDRLFIATSTSVASAPIAAFPRLTFETVTGTMVQVPEELSALVPFGSDVLAVSSDWLNSGRIRRLPGDGGAAVECGATATARVVSARLSPEGRHLWLVGLSGGEPALVGLTLDGRTCATSSDRLVAPLPRGASEVVVSPSGERVYVLDRDRERLLVFD